MASRFARRYRIVTVFPDGYRAKCRDWWWPFWKAACFSFCPTFESARADIDYDKRRRSFRRKTVAKDVL
jgi:hypothetical protein